MFSSIVVFQFLSLFCGQVRCAIKHHSFIDQPVQKVPCNLRSIFFCYIFDHRFKISKDQNSFVIETWLNKIHSISMHKTPSG